VVQQGRPGWICRNFPPYGVACSDQLNPWPLLAGAVVSRVGAAVLFVHASSRDAGRPATAGSPLGHPNDVLTVH
jgi:hypothetical protein